MCPFLLLGGSGTALGWYASATAIDVTGECSAEAVEKHFEDGGIIGALGALESAQGDYSRVSLSQMLRDRDALAAEDLPPCLHDVREEKLKLVDSVISGIDAIQIGEPGVGTSLWSMRILWDTVIHTRRVLDASHKLEEATGAVIDGESAAGYPAPGYRPNR